MHTRIAKTKKLHMKKLSFLLVGAVALMSFTACSSSSSEDDSSEPSAYEVEKKAAENATFSSSDDGFSMSGDTIFISFSADGGEVTIDVDCDVSCFFWGGSLASPHGYRYTSDGIIIMAEQNSAAKKLTSTLYLRTVNYSITVATFVITQEAPEPPEAYLILSEEEFLFSSVGDQVNVGVESNYDWTYECDEDWLTVAKNSGGTFMTITSTINFTGAEREGYVTVTAGDGEGNDASATLKVVQTGESVEPLILEYTFTSNNPSVTLPIYDFFDITIDWDDGNITTFSSGDDEPSHSYSTPGIYDVAIYGAVGEINYYRYGKSSSHFNAIKQWGSGFKPTSMCRAFYECSKLTSLPEVTNDVFVDVTDFSYAFYNCTSLESLPEDMFSGCSSATKFSYVFYRCSFLTTLPEGMFSSCTSAGSFSFAFYGCTALKTLPEGMFSNCSSASSFIYTFYDCSNLTTVPENLFSDCSKASDFFHVFDGCKKLTGAPSFGGLSRVTSFEYTFNDCSSMTTIPNDIFDGCTLVTSFGYTFNGCKSLESVPVSLFDGCMSVTDFGYTFCDCSSVSGESPYMEMEIDGENVKIHIYERPTYAVTQRWITPETYKGCFKNSTFSDYDSVASGWK